MIRAVVAMAVFLIASSAMAESTRLTMSGAFRQGGLVIGSVPPGSRVTVDGVSLPVDASGAFLLGFNRTAEPTATLEASYPDGQTERRQLAIEQRTYDIQRINGLPSRKVTPKPEDLARIGREATLIKAARAKVETSARLLASGFAWPAIGRISGVYGSQRVLNGVPKKPHYGVDIAGPVGAPVSAIADGTVLFAHPGMFFNGKTLLIDHGLGLVSVYIHMSDISVTPGQRVVKGQRIGAIGKTGRATGPHLHWEVSLGAVKLDPALLVGSMPAGD